MAEIPDDIMKAAEDLIPKMDKEPGKSMRGGIVYYTALAIMKERERCAAHCELLGYSDIAHDLRNPYPRKP